MTGMGERGGDRPPPHLKEAPAMTSAPTIDQARLDAFMGRFVEDIGGAIAAPLFLIGDKLGLYRAMADAEPLTPAELAERTGCHERYVREWLCHQAAGGYVEYDGTSRTSRSASARERASRGTRTTRGCSGARSGSSALATSRT
jgi:hypothetical protein